MPPITSLRVSAYEVPTAGTESDGTLSWSSTTVVVAEPSAAGKTGLGFSYAPAASAWLINDVIADRVLGRDAFDVPRVWSEMVQSVRNFGRSGAASMAIAAVDIALWDLKAKLLDIPLVTLLGPVRDGTEVYGSGGFTSLSDAQLVDQLSHWTGGMGIKRVKIKVGEAWGTRPERDLERTALARRVIGDEVELFVDANGGYRPKQAVRMARRYEDLDVRWFEEPVPSDHLGPLAEVRALTSIDVTAGEYGYDLFYFRAMCQAGAVDCLQADISRCAGVSEWVRVGAIAEAYGLQVSGHCAQSLHLHPACAVGNVRHLEYFADHERLERTLFDGVVTPVGGVLYPDLGRPGIGLEIKAADAEHYRIAP